MPQRSDPISLAFRNNFAPPFRELSSGFASTPFKTYSVPTKTNESALSSIRLGRDTPSALYQQMQPRHHYRRSAAAGDQQLAAIWRLRRLPGSSPSGAL
jgi:hypothetical protein